MSEEPFGPGKRATHDDRKKRLIWALIGVAIYVVVRLLVRFVGSER